jgi:uncharacterized protein (TIGR02118 family)
MRATLFVAFYARKGAPPASAQCLARASHVLRSVPGLVRGLLYTPAVALDPFVEYPPPPQLAFQLYFDDIGALEAACGPAGPLQALATADALPSVEQGDVQHQAMVVRAYPVPDPAFRTPRDELPCSDVIHYPGAAEDLNGWLSYYLTNHIPLMKRLPGIRELEIYTRLDWVSALPWPRVAYMQRNKVVFDDARAAAAAFASPIRAEMRKDFLAFPRFSEGNRHNPMATRLLA